MAVFNEPTKWQTSLVNSGDANVIPQSTPVGTGEASFEEGFPQITQVPIGAGGQAPDRKDFNGLFKILGDWIFFNQNGGVSTYSEDFDYVAGRVVSYNDNLYKCIQANGVSSTVVAPDSGTEYWQRIDNFVRSVNGVGADEQGNVQLDGLVKSVNGATADASGNVTVKTSVNVDYTAGVNFTASSTAYTVPYDGFVKFPFANNFGVAVYINGISVFTYKESSGGNYGSDTLYPVSKGDVITSSANYNCVLYPLK